MSKYCSVSKRKNLRLFPQERLKLRRLIRGMNRLVRQLWCKRGGYDRYWVNVRDKASLCIHSKVLKKLWFVRFLKLLKNNNHITKFNEVLKCSCYLSFYTCNNQQFDFIISFKYVSNCIPWPNLWWNIIKKGYRVQLRSFKKKKKTSLKKYWVALHFCRSVYNNCLIKCHITDIYSTYNSHTPFKQLAKRYGSYCIAILPCNS